jgi:hypothetical protein
MTTCSLSERTPGGQEPPPAYQISERRKYSRAGPPMSTASTATATGSEAPHYMLGGQKAWVSVAALRPR